MGLPTLLRSLQSVEFAVYEPARLAGTVTRRAMQSHLPVVTTVPSGLHNWCRAGTAAVPFDPFRLFQHDMGMSPGNKVDTGNRPRQPFVLADSDVGQRDQHVGAPAQLPDQPPRLRAWGVVAPDAAPSELWAAVGALAAGLCVLPPPLLAERSRASVQTLQDYAADETLTARELAMLQLLAEGLTNRQIAARTAISEHTVKFHLSSIFSKLGVASRTEAIRVGAQRGLVVW